jgi:hypothetical protein
MQMTLEQLAAAQDDAKIIVQVMSKHAPECDSKGWNLWRKVEVVTKNEHKKTRGFAFRLLPQRMSWTCLKRTDVPQSLMYSWVFETLTMRLHPQ